MKNIRYTNLLFLSFKRSFQFLENCIFLIVKNDAIPGWHDSQSVISLFNMVKVKICVVLYKIWAGLYVRLDIIISLDNIRLRTEFEVTFVLLYIFI